LAYSRSLLRKFKKLFWQLRARALAIMFHMSRHAHHSGFQAPSEQKSSDSRSKTQKLDARLGRLRGRSRGRDDGVKRSAKEEQLWKIKADTLKEKSRQRKQEAMDRWKVAATTSGAFRGV